MTACRDGSVHDLQWMRQALALAQTVMTSTAPNPRVGCVIVRNGQILGSGVTQPAGQAHAEIMALQEAVSRHGTLHDATVYVTLEPCSHQGRTAPCVQALIQARPARVVVAMPDPNPAVSGKGLRALRDAGIDVTCGVATPEALALNPGFASRFLRGRPWVWLKLAASLDGYLALPDGESKWITSAESRADGHHRRARSCVVLTGSGTVLADDPLLTVRDVVTARQPVRAIVDTDLRVPDTARIFDGDPVWLFTAKDDTAKAARLAERNVELVRLPRGNAYGLDLDAMLRWMADRHINEVHVEAGSRLSGALLHAQCVDEVVAYMAPVFLGRGLPMVDMDAPPGLDRAPRFEITDVTRIGSDARITSRHSKRWHALGEQLSTLTLWDN